MRRLLLLLAILLSPIAALAQADTTTSIGPGNIRVLGYVPFCRTGIDQNVLPCGSLTAPLNVQGAPFRRLHSAPIRLKALGPVAKSFAITRPPDATTYRIVNPCDVDIRLLGTMNEADQVTLDTGVLYLARTEATMGTSKPTFISAMTLGTPTGDCTPEMHYGMGGG